MNIGFFFGPQEPLYYYKNIHFFQLRIFMHHIFSKVCHQLVHIYDQSLLGETFLQAFLGAVQLGTADGGNSRDERRIH